MMMLHRYRTLACGLMSVAILTLPGCDAGKSGAPKTGASGSGAGAEIIIDGSSTVAPISTAVSEEFSIANPGVRVPVGTSGTGGGFKKFVLGETDINDASRPIKESEIELCKEHGIEFIELKVAIDGLTVVVNSANDFCQDLSTDELKRLWEPESKVSKWSEVRAGFPEEDIELFGPDTDSGTFGYFTEEICGAEGASRSDYQQSADDNFLVTGVAGDKYALGYFGYAYYIENKEKLKAVAISTEGGKAILPEPRTIEDGTYTPLSRKLFLYVNKASLSKPMMADFLRYYFSEDGRALIKESGYISLSDEEFAAQLEILEQAITEASGN